LPSASWSYNKKISSLNVCPNFFDRHLHIFKNIGSTPHWPFFFGHQFVGEILYYKKFSFLFFKTNDAPPNSLIDLIVSPKVKIKKGKRVGVHSPTRSTSGVEGHARILVWGLRRVTSGLIIHMDLHKPNNKLVSA
jgi:hypothetical protein